MIGDGERKLAAAPRTPLNRHGTKGKASEARQRARKRSRWKLQFLSPEFVRFTKARPCVKCGRVPSEVSHDPSRGAGGTWTDTHPACTSCHRELHRGHETFWASVGITREQANAAHREAWENKVLDTV